MDNIIDINEASKTSKKARLHEADERTVLADGTNLSDVDIRILKDMNKRYTHVVIGGKNIVVSMRYCQVQGQTPLFQSLGEFKNNFTSEGRIGLGKKKNRGDAWLLWSGHNHEPYGTGFFPIEAKKPKGVFNFFRGFAIKGKAGDCSIYLNHLKEVICNNDQAAYEYLVGWLAHLFQKPDEKPGVSIVMKSVEGTGKGAMAEPLLKILGAHGNKTNGAYALTGRFNGIVANRLLIFADETDLTDGNASEKIKAMITEPTVNMERKGLEIEPLPNFCRFIFASNHARALNAGKRERRFLVLEPSEAKAQDKEYFTVLWNWINKGGAEKLLNYLLSVDISNFNPHKCPQTQSLVDEKLANLRGIDRYFYEEIAKQQPFGNAVNIFTVDLVNWYVSWSEINEEKASLAQARSLTGKMMARLGINVSGRSDRGNGRFYPMPYANEIKRYFADYLDIPVERLEQ